MVLLDPLMTAENFANTPRALLRHSPAASIHSFLPTSAFLRWQGDPSVPFLTAPRRATPFSADRLPGSAWGGIEQQPKQCREGVPRVPESPSTKPRTDEAASKAVWPTPIPGTPVALTVVSSRQLLHLTHWPRTAPLPAPAWLGIGRALAKSSASAATEKPTASPARLAGCCIPSPRWSLSCGWRPGQFLSIDSLRQR